MKKVFALVAIFISAVIVVSCTNPDQVEPVKTGQPSSISPSEKQVIEKEISAITQSFFQNIEKLDIDACMSIFEDTTVFLAVNPDGTAGDYNSLKKMNGDGFSQMSAFKSVLNKEAISVLSVSNVLYTFFASQEFTLKTGERMKMDHVAGTMLFEKTGGIWKATFYHESGAHPVKVDTK